MGIIEMAFNRQAYLPGKRTLSVVPELTGKTLTCDVSASRDLRWFFRNWQFDIRYEQDIHAEEGVLSIPGVALILPFAWMTGSDLHVRCLDRSFYDAALALQKDYRGIYPKMPFGTRLIVDRLVDSPPNPEGVAMLFSGGLDATYAFYANRDRKPRLVQVFGTEFPSTNTRFLDLVVKESSNFAEKHGVEISFIHTTFFQLFNLSAIMHRFLPVRERVLGSLWKGMGYAVGFLSMAAPLSSGRFNHMIIAAWANKEHADRMRENPDSSSPRLDQKIAWSNLDVEHYGCLHRYEKVQAMKDWLPGNHLRVCWRFADALEIDGAMNCNRCEKCARSILALAIGGVDPSRCGFLINEETIDSMKNMLLEGKLRNSHLAFWWGPMQRMIPDHIEGDMFGLSKFMAWFRDIDLGNGLDPKTPIWSIERLYSLCPLPIAVTVRSAVYRVLGEPHWVNATQEKKENQG